MVSVAQYLQAASVIKDYENDLYINGRNAARQLLGEVRRGPSSGDPILPRLAVVLFTQADDLDGVTADDRLRQLCAGINDGLGNSSREDSAVPVIGLSVAAIPNLARHKLHERAFSITLLAARQRDLAAHVGGSAGFVDESNGHEKAWTRCLADIQKQASSGEGDARPLPDDGFVLAFFPGLVERDGAIDFKARNLASYRFLRDRVSADLPVLGAGAGDQGRGPQRQCHVMAGRELISQGYACARVHTTLRFKVSMEHDLVMASEVLLVKELRDGERGKEIVSFAVPPAYETLPARKVLEQLQTKYRTDRFVFRTVEFDKEKESLLFLSISQGEDTVKLAGPVHAGTLIRPAFIDREQPIFRRGFAMRVPERAPVAAFLSFSCYGMLRLVGEIDEPQRLAALSRLRQAVDGTLCDGVQAAGLVFGEWGPGPDLNGHAGYYHSTTLALADALTPRHLLRRQMEIQEECANAMHRALHHAEEAAAEDESDRYQEHLSMRAVLAVLARPLFAAAVDLGFDGGLIWLVEEVDQRIYAVEADGEAWLERKGTAHLALDSDDPVARLYQATNKMLHESQSAVSSIGGCNSEQSAAPTTLSLPLLCGRRCLGVLEVGPRRQRGKHGEERVLTKLAGRMAEHLDSVRSQATLHKLEEAVRSAIACDDQEEGWTSFAQAAARAVEVPFCAIRAMDATGKFLKLVGGTIELVALTRKAGRTLTSIREGHGPMVAWFRQFDQESRQQNPAPGIVVVHDTAKDHDLQDISGAVPEVYDRVRAYALGALAVPQQGVQGMIAFLSYQPNFFNPERQELVRKIARYAAIIAKVYKSTHEQAMLKATFALATIATDLDPILRGAWNASSGHRSGKGQEGNAFKEAATSGSLHASHGSGTSLHEVAFSEAAKLLVEATLKILPCEACALHRFEGRRYLVLQAAAPDESIHDKKCWDMFKAEDHGFMLYLATQREIFRGAGEALRAHERIREKTKIWNWLPKTKTLHSILAIPLVDPNGRNYGLLTLFNQLDERLQPGDELDFTSVDTRLRALLQETATHALESLEASQRFARLAALAQQLQLHANRFVHSTDHIDVDSILCEVAASLAAGLDADICSIYLLKLPQRQLLLRGCYGWRSERAMLRRASYSFGHGLTGILAEHDEPSVIASIFEDTRRSGKYFSEMYGPPDATRTYEMIALPLRYGNKPLGIITLYRKLPREVAHLHGSTARDLVSFKLAAHLASLAIATIAGAPPTEEAIEDERPAIAEILSVAGQGGLRRLDYDELADRIASRFRAGLCAIFLSPGQELGKLELSGASGALKSYVGASIEVPEGPVGLAFKSPDTVFRDLPAQLEDLGTLDRILKDCLGAPLENLAASPMRLGEKCDGVILLLNRAPLALNELRAQALAKYHLEAVGTGIMLVRRNIDYTELLPLLKTTITESRDATTKGWAASTMAHQLSIPIGKLKNRLDLLRRSLESGSDAADALDSMDEAVSEVTQARDEALLSIHRESEEKLERLDLGTVVSEAIQHIKPTAQDKGIDVVSEIASGTVCVRGGLTHLVYVISTIIENAVEAIEEKSREEGIDEDCRGLVRITVEPLPEQHMVRLAIEDSGPGIPPRDRWLVFTREYTTKGKTHKELRGYGLHLAKLMQLAQGGDVEVDGSMVGGARFLVWIPGEFNAQGADH